MNGENLLFEILSKKRKLKKCLKFYFLNYLGLKNKNFFFLKVEERKMIYFLQENFKGLLKFNFMKIFYLTFFFRFYEYQSQIENFFSRNKIFLKFLSLILKKNFEFFSNSTSLALSFPSFFK